MVDGLVEEFGLDHVHKVSEPGMTLGNFLKALAAKAERERAEEERKKGVGKGGLGQGAKVASEVRTARGVADAIIETKTFVWVFEFKFNKSAKAAVRQIREKGCADAYKGDMRSVTLVGINFRTAKRNIDEPLFAQMRS